MILDLVWNVARVLIGSALVLQIARRWQPLVLKTNASTERLLTTGLLAAWLVIVLVAGLGLIGQLGAHRLLIAAVLLLGATFVFGPRPVALDEPPPGAQPHASRRFPSLWPILFAAPILLWDIGWRLPAPATDWDALTYHLYFPARWLQAGQLLHIPTVFGDPAAAFAPQNGALFFTWWVALLGGDALTNVVNSLSAVILALSVYGLAKRSGLTKENAALAGAGVFWIGPMRSALFEARVDLPMLAFWGASLLLVARGLDAKRPAPWMAAGLATGLSAGTKVVGLTLVGPQALFFFMLLAIRREWSACIGFLVACVAGGGWWFVVNIVAYGNPLFPLDLRFGEWVVLPGAIPFEAVAGQFQATTSDLVGRVLPHFYGWAAMILTLLGFVGLGVSTVQPGPHRRVRILVFTVALYWTLFYFFRMPHNTETRFLLPVVTMALVGWAWILEPLQRRNPWLNRAAWALSFLVLFIDIERLDQWRALFASPAEAGIPVLLWIPLCLGTFAAFLFARFTENPNLRGSSLAAGILGLSISIGLGQASSVERRAIHYSKTKFRDWASAMEEVERLDAEHEMRIAYTGLNLPYTLTGPRLTRRVRYVNTQGDLDDGFYDFWRRDPNLATRQKPGLYRGSGRDDYDQWVRNLERAEIDWVLILRLHKQERYLGVDNRGFPIERSWALRHSDRFERMASSPAFELYRFQSIR